MLRQKQTKQDMRDESEDGIELDELQKYKRNAQGEDSDTHSLVFWGPHPDDDPRIIFSIFKRPMPKGFTRLFEEMQAEERRNERNAASKAATPPAPPKYK